MAIAIDLCPARLITHSRQQRLDAILASTNACRIYTPSPFYTVDFSNARDHVGVSMLAHNPLQPSPPLSLGIGSIAHWPQSLLYKFKRHDSAHPNNDCLPVARVELIHNEMAQFVWQSPQKTPEVDYHEQNLHTAITNKPRCCALHDLAAFMRDK